MQPLNHTESFLREIKSLVVWKEANPEKDPPCNPCCIGVDRVNDMISEVEEAQDGLEEKGQRDWAFARPDYFSLAAARAICKRISVSPMGISSPYFIRKYNNILYIGTSGTGIIKYAPDGTYLGKVDGLGTATATSNTYDSTCFSMAIRSDGVYAIVMRGRHIVRVFNANGTRKLDVGIFGSAGDVSTTLANNKLYSPADALWLPNGNLVISNSNGNAAGMTSNVGHVSVYNGSTGAWVKTLISNSAVSATNGGCYYPYGMCLSDDGKKLYIANSSQYVVSVVDMDTLTLKQVFATPPELSGHSMAPYGLALDGNDLLITDTSARFTVVLDADTGAYKRHFGYRGKRDNDITSYATCMGVAVTENGYVFSDPTLNRLVFLPKTRTIPILFNVTSPITNPMRIAKGDLPAGQTVVGKSSINVDVPIEEFLTITEDSKIFVPLEVA